MKDLPKTVTMQSMNSNGPQIVINVCPTVPKQLRYTNMRQDLASKLIALGSVQLVIGIICISLHIVLLVAPNAMSFFFVFGHGIWTGAFFMVTGIFGIVGGKQRARCQVVTFNVLSILAILIATTLLGVSVTSATVTSITDPAQIKFYTEGVVVESLLAFLGLTEAFIAIASSAVCCSIGACCCDCDDCCCPPSTDSKQDIAMEQVTLGHILGIPFNLGQGFNPNNSVVTFSSGQDFSPNDQLQQMASSNQQAMLQPNAPPALEA